MLPKDCVGGKRGHSVVHIALSWADANSFFFVDDAGLGWCVEEEVELNCVNVSWILGRALEEEGTFGDLLTWRP